jgi:hypothetical protein
VSTTTAALAASLVAAPAGRCRAIQAGAAMRVMAGVCVAFLLAALTYLVVLGLLHR